MDKFSDEFKNKACIEFCGHIQSEHCLKHDLQSCEAATNYYMKTLKYPRRLIQ
jgi:hypothetical protein